MNVLVAGATGAIGRPLICALVSARHNVFGMTSSKLGLQTLKEDGAEGLLASALDAQAVDALRYGFFYGPGTWFRPDGDAAHQVLEQRYPIVGSGSGVWSWVHVEDAAAATVALRNSGQVLMKLAHMKVVSRL